MTSPDSKTPSGEGGGMLPALLAGAGILAVAAVLIFGGDDESTDAAKSKDAQAQNQAQSASAKTAGQAGVAAREVDAANKSARPQPRLNPRLAGAVVTEGMAPVPNKKPEPTSFESTEAEIAYWEEELRDANRMLEIRQRASEHVPVQEQKIRERGTPEDLAEFQQRKQVVTDNLERAQARVDEVSLKLEQLRGG